MTEYLFIEARQKFEDIDFSSLNELPSGSVSLAASVQYLDILPKVKKYLESNGHEVIIKKGAYHEGHVLGCNANAFESSADNLLLLVDGRFHALNNAIIVDREIYVFNSHTMSKIEQKELDDYKKKVRGKQTKFVASSKVGLLVTTKEGQKSPNIFKIKKRIEDSGKKVYVFECDSVSISEFENFPDIKLWINTACFGMAHDSPNIVNLSDILEFL
jgi:diphthamide biosynthesis enzyme Dph1/Dph2-like protein